MAQNITLLGASYSAVPAVTLPKTGGGSATFTDVTDTTAAASDVASGKYFYTAAGVLTQGTNSGGGGGGIGTLLATLSMGTISTTSTTATDTGKSISVSNANKYDLLIVLTSCTKTNNRHYGTARVITLYNSSDATSRTSAYLSSYTQNWKVSNNVVQLRCGTTAQGIYPNSCTISNGTATIPMYQRYNSTNTGTINGTYTASVYGVNLYDLMGG